ncbi:ketopantoate reductase family protein [Thalassobacillus sp. CUG 92003]|uniref:ketopantoate reductase family protein n=1 Tax=Thalassobacillus sp. CUG 92003 TaxID=2736641 RepID=UPI0015E71AD2|nr:2-dehydropantoate 2-reductase [Thalassobacillus sp. CUG 92003]
MNIVIAGAGAMGGRFGSMLFQAGNQVVLVDEWKEHMNFIQQYGLEVTNEAGKEVIHLPASFPETHNGEYDLLILLTKAMETERMLKKCRHLIKKKTKVLTLQNGLGNIEVLERFIPRKSIYAGVTTFAARMTAPGRMEAFGSGVTEIMHIDNEETPEANELVDTFNYSGIHASLSNDVMKSIWKKAIFNSVLNPLCTLLESSVSEIGSYKEIDILIDGMIKEALPVAAAEGIGLNFDEIKHTIKTVFDPSMSGSHMSSMYQDILRGRKTEIDYLNGAIVQKAEKHGLFVPSHLFVYQLIRMLEESAKKKCTSENSQVR